MSVSVIVPTLNAAGEIAALLAALKLPIFSMK